jgi:putative peptidoglycan lipid II flippase
MSSVGDNVQVVRNTATISLFNVLGLMSGLAVDMLLAARFGLSEELDALFSALTLPQLIFAVLTMAFNAVLVPTFSHALTRRGKEGAWQLFSNIATIAWLLVAGVAFLGVLASPSLVAWMFPGLTGTSRAMAVHLSRICFWLRLPAGVIHAASAMLNTHHRFAPAAALNLVQYSVVLVLGWLGMAKWDIAAVAAGYVVGAFAQLLMMAVAIRSIGGRYRPVIDWRDPEVRNVGRLLLPLLSQNAIGQSSTVVERLLASYLPPGTITAVAYARRILRAVTDVFVNAVSTALLPRFSALSAGDDVPGLKRAMGFGVRLVSFVTVPVVTLLVVLNVPVVRLALQRGAWDASATQITAGLMGLYVLSVPPLAILQIMVNAFFAMRDTVTPICLRLFVLAANLVLDVALITAMGPYGLALSLLLARCAGMTGAFLAMRRRAGALKLRLGEYSLKMGLAVALMAAVALAVRWFWEARGQAGLLQQLLAVASASLLGLLAYGAVTVRSGIAEVDQALALIKKRVTGGRVAQAGRSGGTPE